MRIIGWAVAIYENFSARRTKKRGEHFYSGGFTRAIRADKSENFSLSDVKGYAVYRRYIFEGFSKFFYFYDVVFLVFVH